MSDAVLVIQCTGRKRRAAYVYGLKHHALGGHGMPARLVYLSPMFRLLQRYATIAGYDLRILSAKYGLLAPDDKIKWYEQRMTKERAAELKPAVEHDLATWQHVFYQAGVPYTYALPERARPVVPASEVPNMSLAHQGAWLKAQVCLLEARR